jgi:hypothetical protein
MASINDPLDSGVPLTFHRRLLPTDNTRIISICIKCGVVLIGSVIDGLPDREVEHAVECKFNPQSDNKIIPFKAKGRR